VLLKCIDSCVKLVPTINGYKRLVGGEAFWAPNAVTYGYDSRAASIRIISPPSCPPAATRMEVRIPGADMNPYFTLSAIFSLGLRGINKKLALPGPPISHFKPEDRSNGKVYKFQTACYIFSVDFLISFRLDQVAPYLARISDCADDAPRQHCTGAGCLWQ
jgi:hypothetical protein